MSLCSCIGKTYVLFSKLLIFLTWYANRLMKRITHIWYFLTFPNFSVGSGTWLPTSYMNKQILYLFRSFEIVRLHHVAQNSSFSPYLPMHQGVQKDSLLGPLLFLIYTNDIPDALHCLTRPFLDDSSILCT